MVNKKGMSCPSWQWPELEAVGLQSEAYRWRPCGVTWDSKASALKDNFNQAGEVRNKERNTGEHREPHIKWGR